MKITFDIQDNQEHFASSFLFLEIAPKQLTFFVKDDNNRITRLRSYIFEENAAENLKKILLDPIFNPPYRKVIITWVSGQNILMPQELGEKNMHKEMLSLIFGPNVAYSTKADIIVGSEIINVYQIPDDIWHIVNERFPSGKNYHFFSLLPNIKIHDVTNCIHCVFYNSAFSVLVFDKNQVVFANYFNYIKPEDVVYYLLAVCKNFKLDIESVKIFLSGYVEKKSILYEEIYKYFMCVDFFHFDDAGLTCSEELKTFPDHFFSHLFVMASCV